MEKQREVQLSKVLNEMFDVLLPGGKLTDWGPKKHADLVAYGACHLALEYQALTGHPVIELLKDFVPSQVEPPKQEGDALPL